MIPSPSKFHALLIKKDQTTASGERISIQGKAIKSVDSVKLLGMQLDYKLNFALIRTFQYFVEKLQFNLMS